MDIFAEHTKKLGFGLMRLPLLNENDAASIDIEQVKQMVDIFMARGFNYFDTAIMYCGGQSQSATKLALTDRYPRDSYALATKLHTDYFNSLAQRDEVLQQQLQSMGVSYFDYYLLHDVSSERYDKYSEFDCFNWMLERQQQGLMRHIGFSYHDNAALLDKVLSEHPETEFVQLQLNYVDWESEGVQARLCYEVCVKHGKPVVVMEPVRGGMLAKVPADVERLFKEYDAEASVASWAIRFAASLDNVKMVLSGMSNMVQMQDNISFMEHFQPLNAAEAAIINSAVARIRDSVAIPCTGCAYCSEGCPMHIAIPRYFDLYNIDQLESRSSGWNPQKVYYQRLTNAFGKASDCTACGHCEDICPQHLPVIQHLQTVAQSFED